MESFLVAGLIANIEEVVSSWFLHCVLQHMEYFVSRSLRYRPSGDQG